MPTSDTFQNAYKSLNKAQKRAVDAVEGPVMVVAGPGTGKTQILSLRIANILLKTDAAPSSILAIAFTESAVKAMRKRLISIIGNRAYEIPLYTFHGFANDRIQEFPDMFPDIIGGKPITDVERITVIEKILNEGKWSVLRPAGDPSYYIKPILGVLQAIKREGYTPQTFKDFVEKQQKDYDAAEDKVHEKGAYKGQIKGAYKELQEKINKNKELSEVFRLYEKELHTRKQYDFEDMIIEVVHAFETNKNFLQILQERYQYILVDEHQDTNGAQNRMVELLASFHENPNLFVVGDEKQAVYRFQGASLENFRLFKERFSGAEVIHLEDNYRSTQNILDASHSLILKNTSSVPTALRSKHTESRLIDIVEVADTETESDYIASDIVEKIAGSNDKENSVKAEKIKPEEIAIIYRNNRDADSLERALERKDIPFTIQSDRGVFEDIDIAQLITLFDYVTHPEREDLLGKVLLFDFMGMDILAASQVIQKAYADRKSLSDALSREHGKTFSPLQGFVQKAHNEPLRDALEHILHASGFMTHIMYHAHRHDKADKVRALVGEAELYTERQPAATLRDFIAHVNTLREHGLSLSASTPSGLGVQLMTAHKSKGLEFAHVYIVGAYDGHWGNRRSSSLFYIPGIGSHAAHNVEDERRLFYVALTRAKQSVTITYPRQSADGKELLPTQFIDEIDPLHRNAHSIKERAALSAPKQHSEKQNTQYRDYLVHIFKEQGLSVTALNAYLDCPWKYFFNNLLRLPRLRTNPELFGTAVHSALRSLAVEASKEKTQDKENGRSHFISVFEQSLGKMPLPQRDFDTLLEKGRDILGRYYDTYCAHTRDAKQLHLKVEHSIEVPFGDIHLRGTIDKIELNDAASTMLVVDYKTGSPKSRNHILGTVKSSTGDYWRQLVFYKLLLDGNELSKRYELKEGIIDFVEPDEKGNFHRELFPIATEDVIKLKETIERVAKEITSLEYITYECKETCEYCDLADTIRHSLLI